MTRSSRGKPEPLTTSRLLLVPPAKRHAADLFRYGSRADFTTFLDSRPFRTIADAESFVRALQRDNRAGRRLYWVAELKATGQAVGTLGLLFSSAPRHRVADFGYGFSPETWGTGLFSEAAEAVTGYGFTRLRLHRIQAITRALNVRSIKGIEKIGFRKEAVLAQFYEERNGKRSDAAVLALIASKRRKRKKR